MTSTVTTSRFGVVEARVDSIINFPEGIYGFEAERQFVIMDVEEGRGPFKWLQSLHNGDLAFLVVDPLALDEDYHPDLPQEELDKLGLGRLKEGIMLTMVVVPDHLEDSTANLQAPIVINPVTRRARQIICTSDTYPRRHRIFGGS